MLTNQNNLKCAVKILDLRKEIFNLSTQYSALGLKYLEESMLNIDQKLRLLFKSLMQYDFAERISCGSTLLVGEGNLSFTYALVQKMPFVRDIISSTYEKYSELSDLGKYNARLLAKVGVHVMHDVDATRLDKIFMTSSFDTIIFQFPHTGSRETVEGHNANYILACDFIKSSLHLLKKNGIIIITIVDSDYYNNIFKFDEVAKLYKLKQPIKYSFSLANYPGYEHTMTNQNRSALDGYDDFATFEFRR